MGVQKADYAKNSAEKETKAYPTNFMYLTIQQPNQSCNSEINH